MMILTVSPNPPLACFSDATLMIPSVHTGFPATDAPGHTGSPAPAQRRRWRPYDAPAGTASMITSAWAKGKSSVIVTWISGR